MNLNFLETDKIKRRTLDQERLNDITFLAASENEGFANLEIITCKSYNQERAILRAFELGATISTVEYEASKLLYLFPVEEFVETFHDKIMIVINENQINDRVIDEVLFRLLKIDEFKPGQRISLHDIKNQSQSSCSADITQNPEI